MKSRLVAGLALAVSPSLFAQPVPLEPLLVTATGREAPLTDVLASATVLTREDIARLGITDLGDLLRLTAGLEAPRTGGPGQQTSLFLRGANSNATLVLVDGVRVNTAFGGANVQNLRPEQIERIEVVKGPRAAQYGPDAVGGVINIITRAPGEAGSLRVRGGSQSTIDAGLQLGAEREGSRFGLQLDHLDTAGIPPRRIGTENRGHRNSAGQISLSGPYGPLDVAASYRRAQGRTEYVGFDGVQPLAQDFITEGSQLALSEEVNERWSATLRLAQTRDDLQQRESDDRSTTRRRELSFENRLDRGAQQFTVTLFGFREEARFQGFADILRERDFYSLAITDVIETGPHSALLSLAYQDDDAHGRALPWNAEYGYRLGRWQLVGGAGFAVRAPTPFDLDPAAGGNPDLDAEKARSTELALRYRPIAGVDGELRLFRVDTRDLIAFDPSTFTAANIGRARNEGVEASLGARLGSWQARLAGVWQDPIDRDTDQPLLRRAKRTGTLRLDHRLGAHSLGLDVVASGARTDVDPASFARVRAPGYATVSATGSFRLAEGLRLQLRAENLLDADYETVFGFNQPGRSYFAQLVYDWTR